jgi:16S rRNA (guanine1516-N2)-methyltransferase
MSDLIKIKMSDANLSQWPSLIQDAVDEKEHFSLVIEPERKLCDLCDYLVFKEGKLIFNSSELGEMSFDFEELYGYHQRKNYALSKEPLAKALAIKGHAEMKRIVWDTTCGTGKDSLLIHSFGAKVVAFERNPIVLLLLKDALRRFPLDIELVFGDASKLQNTTLPKADAIYYDPMYPAKKKSALARKEMRIFKELVGEDLDSVDFLEWAMKNASDRVVIKRPLEAESVKEKPSASYTGKSTRYDMYKIF